jgi:foldase protein PrsA
VTDAEVAQAFDTQKRQSFPKEADFQKFLRTSGQTIADVHARVRLDLLSNKLRDQVVAGHGQITDQAIEQYYNQHRSRFVEPEARSLRIVLTTRKADAERARAELERGASWKSVARRYSIDKETKRKGGKLRWPRLCVCRSASGRSNRTSLPRMAMRPSYMHRWAYVDAEFRLGPLKWERGAVAR